MTNDEEDLKVIQEKIDKGDELTKDEEAKILGAPESEEEEAVDPAEKIIKADKEEAGEKVDAEETPSEKGAKTAEAKKEADDAAKAERKKLIEQEAEKPIDQAKIEDYSPSERALFFELKKERRKRQEAQVEADTLKFQKAKDEEKARLKREQEAAEAEEDPFDGKDEDDILTVAEVRKALKLEKKQAKAPAEKEPITEDFQKRANLMQERIWLYEAKEKHADVGEVVAYADELLRDDKEAAAEVRDVILRGGNAVLAIYNLIKTHPKFPEVEAKIKAKAGKAAEATTPKKEDKPSAEEEAKTNKDRADRIEKNKEKPKTTGSGGGAAVQTGEYSVQELLEMPDRDFAKLSKEKRERILQQL